MEFNVELTKPVFMIFIKSWFLLSKYYDKLNFHLKAILLLCFKAWTNGENIFEIAS